MTLLGVVSMLLGLLTARFAMIDATRPRVAVFALLYVVHIASTFVYYAYVQAQGGDSELYYYDEFNFYDRGFSFGTGMLIWFVQGLRNLIGGTYLDYFMLFQLFGFAGIALVMRIFEEVYESVDLEQQPVSLFLLFLPSLSFWTSAIGKDAPLFLAAALSLWAAINIRRRYLAFGAAVALMLLIRPHIALIGLSAISISLIFEREFSRAMRVILMIVATGAIIVAISTIQSTLRLDLTDANSISDFLTARDSISQSAAGGNTAVQGSWTFRMISLLIRPFFVDAQDLFGYIASVENGVLLFVYGLLFARFRTLMTLFGNSAFVRYAATFSIAIAVVLSLSYYNVGLGLRQRTMFLPGLLCLFVVLMAVLTVRRENRTLVHA